MEFQGYMRTCCEGTNGLTIHVKAAEELVETGDLLSTLILLVLTVLDTSRSIGVIVG